MSVFFVFYGLINVLPLYATGELHRNSSDAGLLLTVFLLSAIVTRPFTGKVLDIIGKRKMLIISILLYLATTVLYIFIKPFLLLLLLRFIQGIAFSILTTANNSIAADIVPPARRGQGLGYFSMSQNLAIVLGPFVALLIVQYVTFDLLFIVMSAVVLLGAICALSIKLPANKHVEKPKLTFTWSDLVERKVLPVALLGGFVAFSYSGVLSYLTIYAQEKDLLAYASLFYVVFAAAMLLSRPFTGKIYDTKGPKYIIVPGFFIFIIGLIIMGLMTNMSSFLLAGLLIGLGYGALVPSFQAMSVQSTDVHRSGYATATFFTIFDIGIAGGSAILGAISVHYGFAQIYYVSAVVLVIGAMIYFLTQNKLTKNQTT
ncbi:MFS transporter [Kurthia sibirica]|uniref:MFS transporter n=2 Tax=Kurthia sibirica TaxID=202750 RepID=A0A2U3APX1_9BACL|nr:MFS transporter [Kurthia sibirica]